MLRIGDTLCEGAAAASSRASRASRPSTSCACASTDPLKRKQLKKGLDQLSEEGAVQLFFDRTRLERDPILGAVGVLQFEVIQHRLKSEYGVNVGFDRLPYLHARWVEGEPVEPGQFERAGLAPPRCWTSRAGRWSSSPTSGRMRTATQDNPHLKFIAAVQPGRSARSAA